MNPSGADTDNAARGLDPVASLATVPGAVAAVQTESGPHGQDRANSPPDSPGSTGRITRFVRATRLLHWLNGGSVLFLLVSGLLLYLPTVKARALGQYRLVPLLHVIVGGVFIVAPLLLLLVSRQRQPLIADVAGALTPRRRDIAWLKWLALSLLGARLRQPAAGKFNAGQKLNTLFWVLGGAALAATGLVLAVNFFTKNVFDAAFVERVFPIHEVIALVAIVPLAGHLYVALLNRDTRPALPGIITGDVDAAWARAHHAEWVAEREAAGAVPPTGTPPR